MASATALALCGPAVALCFSRDIAVCPQAGPRYNPRHAGSPHVFRFLAYLRFGAPRATDADVSFRGHADRLADFRDSDCAASAVVSSVRSCRSVLARVVFALFRRAQSPCHVRPSAVVVARRSKNGGDGAGGKNERRSRTMCCGGCGRTCEIRIGRKPNDFRPQLLRSHGHDFVSSDSQFDRYRRTHSAALHDLTAHQSVGASAIFG